MRKITLLVASLLLISNVTIASEKNVFIGNEEGYRFITDYRDADPIVFKERGIEFFIFSMVNLILIHNLPFQVLEIVLKT